MSRNPLANAADAAGDGFATTENGTLRVPGESPTTYQWQRYVERLELEVENKSLGHVLREANGPEHDKVPPHIDIEAELPVLIAGEGITARDVMRRGEQRAKALRENVANDARRASYGEHTVSRVCLITPHGMAQRPAVTSRTTPPWLRARSCKQPGGE